MKIKRFKGDTYPIEVTLFIDETVADLTDISVIEFAYMGYKEVNVIVGSVVDATAGQVKFIVEATEFSKSGTFSFDIRGTYTDGVKRTFIKDTLIIEENVNKY